MSCLWGWSNLCEPRLPRPIIGRHVYSKAAVWSGNCLHADKYFRSREEFNCKKNKTAQGFINQTLKIGHLSCNKSWIFSSSCLTGGDGTFPCRILFILLLHLWLSGLSKHICRFVPNRSTSPEKTAQHIPGVFSDFRIRLAKWKHATHQSLTFQR